MANIIGVLLADNAELFREGLTRLLEDTSNIKVVSTCSTGRECIDKATLLKPDIIMLGSTISEYDCVETTRQINQIIPGTHVIILIHSEEGDQLSSILKAQASAYISKDNINIGNLTKLIVAVHSGTVIISAAAAGKLLEVFTTTENSSDEANPKQGSGLSEREKQVLSMVAGGATNRQIADALLISENTVKVHMNRIFEKLHTRNRQEAALQFSRKNNSYPSPSKHKCQMLPPEHGSKAYNVGEDVGMADLIKVLLADRAELFREGLARLLEDTSNIKVMSTCSTGRECIDKAILFKPNIIILGSDISEYDCVETTRHIGQLLPDTHVIILIHSEEGDQLLAALKAQASAYISENHPVADLATIISYVNEGMKIISSPGARKLLEMFTAIESRSVEANSKHETGLSGREKEVLSMVARGLTNRQIANALFISENTVKAHVSRIIEKMNVHNRRQAVNMFERSVVAR